MSNDKNEHQYIPKHWVFIENNKNADVITHYGGSASGKTFTTLQYVLMRFLQDGHFEGVLCRKFRPTLKLTLLRDSIAILKDWGVWEQIEYNKSELTFTFRDNRLHFIPLIEPERLKGIDVDMIFIDEVTEIDEEIFNQLLLRFGRSDAHRHAQMITAFNPVSADHWAYRELVQTNTPERVSQHSTHRDNPFLSDKFRARLESLINIDENFYRVYCLGEPGSMTGLVYPSNWEISNTSTIDEFDAFGIDWGWSHPTAIVGIKLIDDRTIAVKELFYESDRLIESEVIPWMKANDYRFGFKKHLIYPDTANPGYNQLLEMAGFRVGKTNKEVLAGINFIRGYHLRITGDSVNLITEIRDYKWQTDRNGKETDEPVKVFDDAMDAMRYAIVSHLMIGTQALAKPVCMTGNSFVWQ